jgi:protein phosphatase
METNKSFLKTYAEIITPESSPPARFGHTVNVVSRTNVVVFGGAISSPGNYTMTADLYLYNMAANMWKRLERTYTYL